MLVPAVLLGAAGNIAVDVQHALRSSVLQGDGEYVITLPSTINSLPQHYDSLRTELLGESQPIGSTWIKIYFFENDATFQTVTVNVQITKYQDVLVSKRPINRQELLLPDGFDLVRKEITTLSDPPVSSFEELKDMEASRQIPQGKMLTRSLMAKEELIKRGASVTIEYVSGSIKVTATGEAKQSGSRGDVIKVRNLNSNKIISAEVQDEQSVKVTR